MRNCSESLPPTENLVRENRLHTIRIYRRYSQWLEDHPSERDRLQLIQGTLESYVAACRARQDKAYAFPYSIMLELLENYNR